MRILKLVTECGNIMIERKKFISQENCQLTEKWTEPSSATHPTMTSDGNMFPLGERPNPIHPGTGN